MRDVSAYSVSVFTVASNIAKTPLQYLFLHCMQGSYILFFQTFIAAVPVVQPAAVDDMHFSVHTSASQLP